MTAIFFFRNRFFVLCLPVQHVSNIMSCMSQYKRLYGTVANDAFTYVPSLFCMLLFGRCRYEDLSSCVQSAEFVDTSSFWLKHEELFLFENAGQLPFPLKSVGEDVLRRGQLSIRVLRIVGEYVSIFKCRL